MSYANTHELAWINDESNDNTAFTRNFLRHEIMPALKSRWPNAAAQLARSAQHCAEAVALLDESAHEKLQSVHGSRDDTLSAYKLLQYNEAWQRLLLRTWIEEQGFGLPDTASLSSIQKSVLASGHDRMPCVRFGQAEVRRHRDDIHILTARDHAVLDGVFEWDMQTDLSLAPVGTLTAAPVEGYSLKLALAPVSVRFRIPGETVELASRGRISLKNLFQEWGVPAWERGQVPLIFSGGHLAAAAGYFIDKAYTACAGEAGVELGFVWGG
jgi:tRNA(Ile)-lysidine synthase